MSDDGSEEGATDETEAEDGANSGWYFDVKLQDYTSVANVIRSEKLNESMLENVAYFSE